MIKNISNLPIVRISRWNGNLLRASYLSLLGNHRKIILCVIHTLSHFHLIYHRDYIHQFYYWSLKCCDFNAYLMEVDVVIERYNIRQLGRPEPSYSVSANGQEYESHVELQSLSRTFGRGKTVTHNVKSIFLLVLNKLPCKQPNHYANPQC